MGSAALNATASSLLGLLHDCGQMTGADLARTAQTRIGNFWNMTRSQVYRELAALEAAGYVTAGPRGARDARPYAITAAGTAAFRQWLATTEPAETIRLGLLVLVAFGRHLPPGRLPQLLNEHAQQHRDRLAEYRDLDARLEQAGADPFVRATLSFGMHYEQAVLAWFDALPEQVRSAPPGPAEVEREVQT